MAKKKSDNPFSNVSDEFYEKYRVDLANYKTGAQQKAEWDAAHPNVDYRSLPSRRENAPHFSNVSDSFYNKYRDDMLNYRTGAEQQAEWNKQIEEQRKKREEQQKQENKWASDRFGSTTNALGNLLQNEEPEERTGSFFDAPISNREFNARTNPNDLTLNEPADSEKLDSGDSSFIDKAIWMLTNIAGLRGAELVDKMSGGQQHINQGLGVGREMRGMRPNLIDAANLINSTSDHAGEDTFGQRFLANLNAGYNAQRENEAWNDYMNAPSDYTRDAAVRASDTARAFNEKDADLIGKGGLISNDLASYLPQFMDQVRYEAAPAIIGTAIGGADGYKVGRLLGSAGYSYQSMRGAAFKALISNGVDEKTALNAASNESVISTVVEMGDEFVNMALGVVPGVSTAKAGIGAIKDQIMAQAWGKFGKFAAQAGVEGIGYLTNIGSEGLEEYIQECVSIANERSNGTDNIVNLLGDALDIAFNGLKDLSNKVQGNEISEDSQRLFEAFGGGARLALMLHPAGRVANTATEVMRNNATGRQIKSSGKAADIFQVAQEAVQNADIMEEAAQTNLEKLQAADQKKQAEAFMSKAMVAAEDGKQLSAYEIGKQANQNDANARNTVVPHVVNQMKEEAKAVDTINVALNDAAENGGVTTDEAVLSILDDDKAVEIIEKETGKDFSKLSLKEQTQAVENYIADSTREYVNGETIRMKSETMGNIGSRVLNENFERSGISNANEYIKTMDAYYSYGAQLAGNNTVSSAEVASGDVLNSAMESVGMDINNDAAHRAIIAGYNDVTNGNIELTGGQNGTEKTGGSGSGRIYNVVASGQTESAPGERSKAAEGYSSGKQRRAAVTSEVNDQIRTRNGQRVSAFELGLSSGTDSKRNVVLDDKAIEKLGYTEKVRELERRTGAKVILVSGEMEQEVETKDGKRVKTYVRGVYDADNNRLICQADNRNLEFDKLGLHEEFHGKLKGLKGAERERFIDEIKSKLVGLDDAEFDELVQAYDDKYGWSNMGYSDADIVEEIFADAYAGIDVWDYLTPMLGATRYTDAVRKYAEAIVPSEMYGDDGFAKYSMADEFEMAAPLEETDRLIAIHNMHESALQSMIDLGGLAMPSFAVKPAHIGHTTYGVISVIAGKDSIDPTMDRDAVIYGGDAWTPTFPEVHIKPSNKALKAISKRMDKVFADEKLYKYGGLGTNTYHIALDEDNARDAFERWGSFEDAYGRNNMMKLMFLKETGRGVPITQMEKAYKNGYDRSVFEKVNALIDVEKRYDYSVNELKDEYGKEINNILREFYLEKYGDKKFGLRLADQMAPEGGEADFNDIMDLLDVTARYNYDRSVGNNTQLDTSTVDESIRKAFEVDGVQEEYDSWLKELGKGTIEKKGIRNDKDMFTPSGNRRTFEQLHYDFTLDNIVKAMRSEAKQGRVQFMSGPGSVKGAALKSYKSIEEVRAERNRILDTLGEEGNSAYDEFHDATLEIAKKINSNDWLSGADDLADILGHAKTASRILNYMRKEFSYLHPTMELAEEIEDLGKMANSLPMEYFEAKLYRAFPVSEALAYVVPDNLDETLKKNLRDAGGNVIEYKAEDMDDRLKKINGIEGARFSTEDSLHDAEGEYNDYTAEGGDEDGREALLYSEDRRRRSRVSDIKRESFALSDASERSGRRRNQHAENDERRSGEALFVKDNQGKVKNKLDRKYLEFVRAKDKVGAYRMVLEEARKNGYTIRAYHGTKEKFNVFDKKLAGINYDNWAQFGLGFYFATSQNSALRWGSNGERINGDYVIDAFLKSDKMLDADERLNESAVEFLKDNGLSDDFSLNFVSKNVERFIDYLRRDLSLNSRDVTNVLESCGYEGVSDVINGQGQYVVFEPEFAKSADTVTYDDNGNIIPLSMRFDTNNNDMRFSQELNEYSTNPQIRDTINMYHEVKDGGSNVKEAVLGVRELLGSYGGKDSVRNEQIRTVALGITNEFVKKGFIDFRGKTLSSDAKTAAAELATYASVFRNPHFETFRIFYAKDNVIVGQEAVTSYLVDTSSVNDKADPIKDIRNRMNRLGADTYYLMHNHPSGSVSHSKADEKVTKVFINNLSGFGGHVIMDHNKFGFFDSNGSFSVGQLNTNQEDFTKRIIDSPYLYRRVENPDIVAKIGQDVIHGKEYSALVFAGAGNAGIRAIQEVHNGFVKSSEFANYVANRKNDFGSSDAFLVTSNDEIFNSSEIENAYERNVFRDVVTTGGESFLSYGMWQDSSFQSNGRKKTKAIRVNDTDSKYSTEDSDGNALSSQQQRFFKDSKIRDENGNLIVMYHGSESNFTTFENRPARNGRKYGDGFYFTENQKMARSWGKGNVYKTYLNITNPLTVSANEAVPEALDNALRLQYGDTYDEMSANPKWFGNEYTKEEYIENNMKHITNSQEAFFALEGGNDVLKEHGYDGIVVPAESWMPEKHYAEVVAFDANQIKNSTNKKPTSGTDIRYSTESDDGFYSLLEQEIEQYKGNKIGASSVVSYLKGKGVKDEEIKWTGIVPFLEGKKSVTKDELLDYVRANQLQIEEVGLEGASESIYDEDADEYVPYDDFLENAEKYADDNGYTHEVNKLGSSVEVVFKDEDGAIADYRWYELKSPTRWSEYKTEGGANYREVLFKIPGSTYSNQAMQVHWNQKGVLAHARIQDFDAPSGKMLFVEEIQSDWHNAAQRYGYDTVNVKALQDELSALEKEQEEWRGPTYREREAALKEYQDFENGEFAEFSRMLVDEYLNKNNYTFPADVLSRSKELGTRFNELKEKFESVDKAYKEAEGRQREIAGKIRDIKRQLSNNAVPDAPFKNGKYVEYVMKRLLRVAAEGGYDSIGWTTGKMQEERWSDEYAEGYRIEYDQDIPKFMNKYGKQWGAKVEDGSLFGYEYTDFYKAKASVGKIAGSVADATGVDFDAVYDYIVNHHQSILSRNESSKVDKRLLETGQYKEVGEYWEMDGKVGTTVHLMKLTDSMKESVLTKGQARFSTEDAGYHAGDLGKAESYAQQGYYRGTGHFGTGTYFVGDESQIENYNTRNGVKAPHEKVDFSKYNLYRPGERLGLKLHEALKVLDGGIDSKYLDAAIRGEFQYREPAYMAFYDRLDKYRDEGLEWEDAKIAAYQDELNGIDPEEIEYEFKTYDEFFKNYSKGWEDIDEGDYEFYKGEYVDYLKAISDEYNEEDSAMYDRLRDAVFNLQMMFGFNKDTEKALRDTLAYQEEMQNASYEKQKVSDSLATVFMKSLGYEGIDVRGTNLDNVAYGSVIYDLKGKDLERKKAIGTARYSTESMSDAEQSIRDENDYLKGAYASLLTEVRTDKRSAARMRTNANKTADRIREEYESRINKADLRDRMNHLVQDYIIGGEQNEAMAYQNAKNEAVDIARDIVNNAGRMTNADEYDRYLDLKKRVKNNDGIYLDPSLRGDPEKYQEIRKRLFGKVNLKNSGTPLDSFYQGLVSDFGELFDPDVAPGIDQLQTIEEVLNTLAPIYENPYNGRIAEAIELCANDILMSLTDGTIVPDGSSQNARQQARVEKARQNGIDYARKAIAAERVYEKKRIDNALSYYRNRDKNRLESAERERLRKIANRLNNRKLPKATRDLLEQYIGELDLISVKLTNKRLDNLKDLRLWYEDQQTNNPDFVKDPEIEKLLQRLSTRQISELDIEEVRWLTTCLQNIENELAIAKKTIDTEDQRDIHIQAEESMADIDHSKGNGNNAFTQGIDSFFVNGTLSPVRAMKRIVGYRTDSPIYQRTLELEQGQIQSFDWQRKAEANFLRWTNDNKFMESIVGKKAKMIDIGNGIQITPAMRMSLYLHSKNEQNMRHIIYGGITVPNMKAYKSGNMSKAYGKGSQTVKLNAKQVRDIIAGMTEQEKTFADAAAKYFNGMSQESINEVSEKLKGYSLALVQNYFPINTNSNFTLADYETVKMDGTIEGMGFLKERQNASNPIYLRDITDVLNKSISSTAKYVGLAIPVRNFNKLYNVSSSEFGDEAKAALEEMKNAKTLKERYAARDRMRDARELFTGSMRESVMQNWDVEGIQYIEKMMGDIQNPKGSRSAWAKMFQNVRGNYAGSTLGLSASVAMKQAASYPTAAAVLGWKPLNQAFLDVAKIGRKFDMDLVNRYTPLLWHRASNFNVQYLGNVGTSVNQNRLQKLLSSKALNWITDMDVATTRLLWFAPEHYVQNENKALVKGSDAYYKAVAEVYNRVITETQPNYTTMERPELLRTDDTLLASMMMFKTQSFQNFNVLYDAIGNYSAKKDAVKTMNSDDNKAALTSAKKDLSRAVSSQVVQTFVFAAMTAVCAALLGRKDKYKDDEGEVTMESLGKQVGKDMISSAMSMVPFGGEIYSVLARVFLGEKYYGFDNITASSLDDLFNAFIKAADSVKSGVDAIANGGELDWNEQRINLDSVMNAVTRTFGIPYDNASKIFEAVVQHVAKGRMGEYEGTYTYLRLTKKMSDTGAYYDNLFKAYVNDKKSYESLKKKMIADGFDEEKMRNAINSRLKDRAGVNSVSDLDHKLVDSKYQNEYDAAINLLLKSPEYKKLSGDEQGKRRSAVESTLKDPEKMQKLDDAGIDVGTYALYMTARKLADIQGDNNGSYNKDEKAAAVKMLLNSNEISSAEASALKKYDK